MIKLIRASVVAGVALLALTACGGGTSEPTAPVKGGWDDIVAAANKEGNVTLYSTQAPVVLSALKAAFESKYPKINLTFVRGVDSDLLSKIGAEKRSGKGIGDVAVLTDASWIDTNKNSGYVVNLAGPSFEDPSYHPAESVVAGKFFLEGAAMLGLGWNTKKFPQGLTSPAGLLDPKLKGKIGVVNPGTSPTYIDYYSHIEKYSGGQDFLKNLADQNPRIYPSTQPVAQALASGEISAALMAGPMLPEKEAGAPVGWTRGEHPWGARWYGMALGSSRHPNAAQVLADFMVTRAGQSATSTGYGAVLPDIPGSLALAQDVPEQNLKVTQGESAAKFIREWEALFSR
ncbi:extracellular solute-binding protein [Nocardia jiangxiensis]|uniref:Extracellular solute-binding protein n=1 Tax=Nocardia jiangxiensis TaxID=282685 RepID=A0ABW6S7H9_9NOCA|nr:extracellular solute-binding protein [Nocardia jiangxiensis]